MGAWVSYGLGSENRNLPGFIVLNGGLIPPGGLDNFNSGFLPAAYQGSVFRPADPPVANIRPLEAIDRRSSAQARPAAATRSTPCLRRTRQRRRDRVGHRQLRDRLPHADRRARADGPVAARAKATQATVRPRRRRTAGTRHLRHAVPARPAAGRARRALHRTDLPAASATIAGTSTATCESGHEDNARAVDQPIAALLTRSRKRAACSRTRWSSGPASSAARRSPRAATAAITTRSASRSGWPAAA